MATLLPTADGTTTGWYGSDDRDDNLYELLATAGDSTFIKTSALVREPNVLVFFEDDGAIMEWGTSLDAFPVEWDCDTDWLRPVFKEYILNEGMQVAKQLQSYPKCEHSRDVWLHGTSIHHTGGGNHNAVDVNATDTIFAALHAGNYQTAHVGPKVINGYTLSNEFNQINPDVTLPGWERGTWSGCDEHSAVSNGEQAKERFQVYRESVDKDGNITTWFEPDGAYTDGVVANGPCVEDYFGDIAVDTIDLFTSGRDIDDARYGRPWFMQIWWNHPHSVSLPRSNNQANAGQTWLASPNYNVARDSVFTAYKTWEPPIYRDSTSNGGVVPIDLTEVDGNGDRYYDERGTASGKPQERVRMQSYIAADDQLSRIIDHLRTIGEYRKTYIVCAQDNSFALGLADGATGIGDWNGKTDVREWIGCTAFAIVGPTVPRGTYVDALIANTQMAPMILELTHTEDLRAGPEFDAVNPLPMLLDDPTDLDDIVHYILGQGQQGFRTKRYKYWLEDSVNYFYDIANDPWEETNLWSTLTGAQQTAVLDMANDAHDLSGTAMQALRYSGPA